MENQNDVVKRKLCVRKNKVSPSGGVKGIQQTRDSSATCQDLQARQYSTFVKGG